MKRRTDDIHIKEIKELTPPIYLIETNPLTETASNTVFEARQSIHHLLTDQDDRLLVVIGPCSIHDTKAAIEYAQRLKVLKDELAEDLLVVMRVYFEKPRTTVGWKGLINDPYLDDSYEINDGLRTARKLLLQINDMGMPAGTEYLDMISPQYVADLISWGAIGARTTESQVHRELASGLSCPVGFKNGTDGNLKIAVDAIRAAQVSHHFLSVTKLGHSAIVSTTGNPDCHVILRGGKEPNYDAPSVDKAAKELEAVGLSPKLMVDFSHANSRKDYRRQMEVSTDIAEQITRGEKRIFGVMVESHLNEGRQDLLPGKTLDYGKSITDACIGWGDSEKLLRQLAAAVRARRESSAAQ
ncbi:MAG: 3-deoxy-7-phosphoheptulonate synthase [Neisseriaceae bacterium]|jgi:3-deoxy-7-phosphoheptulonate synthase|nr:3-deoxy-7-phosphoheptulonate synthase [Pseudomonadota bacterium]RTK98029.1 MAG: 3-deoxy-7-phosphoheptulonate synthase [Neisseriaceae bacterium]